MHRGPLGHGKALSAFLSLTVKVDSIIYSLFIYFLRRVSQVLMVNIHILEVSLCPAHLLLGQFLGLVRYIYELI